MINLTVLSKRVGPIRGRHPWVFSGALKNIPEGLESGMPVRLVDEKNNFLAQGYFNSYSQIAVRLWSWDDSEVVGPDFFEKRISAAYLLRKKLVENKKTDSYRLISGENDLLPGLIVDKYSDYLCLQFHTNGLEFWREQIIDALVKVVQPKGTYERSDVRTRGIEGATEKVGTVWGDVPERIQILENGYKFLVDVIGGQKTGFFLDQRDKRLALEKYSKDQSVLNCFSYTGGFSVYALGAGAKRVVSVDVSEKALELAEENIKLNKLDTKRCEFVCADVRAYLTGLSENDPEVGKNDFSVIILDPPAYVKDRHKIKEGLQGYRNINELALRLLPTNGILVTASCSAHVSLSDFHYMLSEAAGRAGRTVQILETYTHGIDHPELTAFTEGEYLKCIFALVR
jgi:23S rRNA (cytosine1962-C5)-methyltransferase